MLFPLRMGVELFPESSFARAPLRVRQASVLFEELVFEAGALDTSITEESSMSLWIPPDQITDDHRDRSRNPTPPGTVVQWGFGAQKERGVPAEKMDFVVSSPLTVGFVSEYHSEILDELLELGADWVTPIITPTSFPSDTPVGKAISSANFKCLGDQELLSDESNDMLKSFIYKSFNRDTALAQNLGAAVSVTPMFWPVAEHFGETVENDLGNSSLGVLVPNLADLDWDSIAAFREHAGAVEAREKFKEFDRLALVDEPRSAFEYLDRVSASVTGALLAVVADQRRKWQERAAQTAVHTAVSYIPAVGPTAGAIAAGAEIAKDEYKWRHSWLGALMELREQ